jgi:uncharacterized protein CbrC (UPF0167 family)
LLLCLAREQLVEKVWLQEQQVQVLQTAVAFHQLEGRDEVQQLVQEVHCWQAHIQMVQYSPARCYQALMVKPRA